MLGILFSEDGKQNDMFSPWERFWTPAREEKAERLKAES
jgi:hypothetical protein